MKELEALIILNNTPLLGSIKIRLLISVFGSAVCALDATKECLRELPGFGPKVIQSLLEWRQNETWYRDLEAIEKCKISLISYTDPSYPKRLLDIADFPILLYIKGKLKQRDEQSIAVVGTRYATVYGKEAAEKISEELVSYGFTIVSGLARGIDTASHIGALKKGRTLAVVGNGLMHTYPKENMRLAEVIAEHGAVISEFPMHTPPDRQHFPQRNRIVSGMTLGTLLIEAPVDSGAMITMNKALGQGRRLYALPGRIDVESFRGNHLLIKQGLAQLIESGKDIAEGFGNLFESHPTHKSQKRVSPLLEEEERSLLALLPNEETAIDDLAILTKLPITKLTVLLMSLVLKKQIREFPGKIYKKVLASKS